MSKQERRKNPKPSKEKRHAQTTSSISDLVTAFYQVQN